VFRVDCGYCSNSVRISATYAQHELHANGAFGFGRHVTDPKAFVMRWLTLSGWLYSGGRIAKTTLTMTCPKCREKLPGLPVDPDDQGK
jgi:hypothetical protein